MKLLFFAPRFHTNQYEIIKGLKREHKVSFHAIFKGKTEDYSHIKPKIIKQSALSVYLQKILGIKNRILIYFPNIKKYFLLLKKEKPDFIILRVYGKVYPYIIGLICKFLKIKIIFYDQYFINLNHLRKKNLLNYLKKFEIFFRCYLFKSITFSPIKSKKVFKNIIYLPFVSNVKKNKKITLNKRKKILIVSKFQTRKNLIFSFDVLESLMKLFDFEVTYVGEVSNDEHRMIYNLLKKKINISFYKKKFRLLKNINFNKMNKIYQNKDIFLLPANNEPASVSILEAMANGLIVICSDSCATRTYLPNLGQNIFKSNDKKNLKESLKFYLQKNKDFLRYKKANYKFCLKNYTFESYYKILLRIFRFYEKR